MIRETKNQEEKTGTTKYTKYTKKDGLRILSARKPRRGTFML